MQNRASMPEIIKTLQITNNMDITLDKKNLADLATELNAVEALSNNFFDSVRKTISDIGEKIQADNCGTTMRKQESFEDCLKGLVESSALPDSAGVISEAITLILKKL